MKAFVDRVSASQDPGGEGEKESEDKTMGTQFEVLNEKLQSLLNTLDKEAEESKVSGKLLAARPFVPHAEELACFL